MSKRDIETVCTLAAHLAQRGDRTDNASIPWQGDFIPMKAERCASDAMKMQRLGARCRRWAVNRHIRQQYWDGLEYRRISAEADKILQPYGLTAKPKSYPMNNPQGCLMILGLPSNGDGPGFGI